MIVEDRQLSWAMMQMLHAEGKLLLGASTTNAMLLWNVHVMPNGERHYLGNWMLVSTAFGFIGFVPAFLLGSWWFMLPHLLVAGYLIGRARHIEAVRMINRAIKDQYLYARGEKERYWQYQMDDATFNMIKGEFR